MGKKEKTIDPQFSEERTGLPGKSCPQQESVRKDGKDLSKKRFNWKTVCFLCILGLMMIVFLAILSISKTLHDALNAERKAQPGDVRMGNVTIIRNPKLSSLVDPSLIGPEKAETVTPGQQE